MKYFIGWCEGCGKVLESDEPSKTGWDGDTFHHNPHYLCSECIHKLLDKDCKED